MPGRASRLRRRATAATVRARARRRRAPCARARWSSRRGARYRRPRSTTSTSSRARASPTGLAGRGAALRGRGGGAGRRRQLGRPGGGVSRAAVQKLHLVVRGEGLEATMSRYLIERIDGTAQRRAACRHRDRRAGGRSDERPDRVRCSATGRPARRTMPHCAICSCSSAPSPTPLGSRLRRRRDDKGFVVTGTRMLAGTRALPLRPACPACSRSATCAPARPTRGRRRRRRRGGRRADPQRAVGKPGLAWRAPQLARGRFPRRGRGFPGAAESCWRLRCGPRRGLWGRTLTACRLRFLGDGTSGAGSASGSGAVMLRPRSAAPVHGAGSNTVRAVQAGATGTSAPCARWKVRSAMAGCRTGSTRWPTETRRRADSPSATRPRAAPSRSRSARATVKSWARNAPPRVARIMGGTAATPFHAPAHPTKRNWSRLRAKRRARRIWLAPP